MPYIYKVTNELTGKSYIGQTAHTVAERWSSHCDDYKRNRNANRPLYIAMQKYGIDAFSVSVIEECAKELLDEREIFWIDYYDSFRNGYNATFGGCGKPMIDYASVFEAYKRLGENCAATARAYGINEDTVYKIVLALGGSTRKDHGCLRVNMFTKDGTFVMTFPSTRAASRYLIQHNGLSRRNEGGYAGHISAVCMGKRKSCQGYIWQYV